MAMTKLPWNDDFDQFLMKVSDETHNYEGVELLHELHKQTIESNWINIRLYRNLSRLLYAVIALLICLLLRTFL
jgi:hypothetical protein